MPPDRLPGIDELAALVAQRAGDEAAAARLRVAIAVGRDLSDLSDALIDRFVAEARAGGMSWAQISHVFGDVACRPGRWTNAANDVLDRAGEEARALGHGYIGTEHALLALVTTPDGLAGEVLRELGVSRGAMLATSCMQPRPHEAAPTGCMSVMPRLKQALEHSRHIADGLGVQPAGTEHVLAGIVAVPDSMAVEILRRLGVSADGVRAALADRLDVDPQRLRERSRRRASLIRR